eukprot:Platyproteum_vivax@DN7540_c2_g1_i3.p1
MVYPYSIRLEKTGNEVTVTYNPESLHEPLFKAMVDSLSDLSRGKTWKEETAWFGEFGVKATGKNISMCSCLDKKDKDEQLDVSPNFNCVTENPPPLKWNTVGFSQRAAMDFVSYLKLAALEEFYGVGARVEFEIMTPNEIQNIPSHEPCSPWHRFPKKHRLSEYPRNYGGNFGERNFQTRNHKLSVQYLMMRWGVYAVPIGNQSVLITMGIMREGQEFKDRREQWGWGPHEKWIERLGDLREKYEVQQIISLNNISDEAALLLPQSQFAKNMHYRAKSLSEIDDTVYHWTLTPLPHNQNGPKLTDSFLKLLLKTEAKEISFTSLSVDKTLDFFLEDEVPVMSVFTESPKSGSFTFDDEAVEWISGLFVLDVYTLDQPNSIQHTKPQKPETDNQIVAQPHYSCYLGEKEKLNPEATEAFVQSMKGSKKMTQEALKKAIKLHSNKIDFVSLLAFMENGPLPT